MLIYAIEISKTASGNTWSFNTPKFDSAILKQVIVKATSNDTTFDFQLIDEKNNNVIDTTISGDAGIGTYNRQFDIPLKGIYTVKALNVSENEAFTGRLMIMEET